MEQLITMEELVGIAKELGATAAAVVEVADIPFRREFRAACEQNTCGKFGRCWMCPPDVGDIDELIAIAKGYRYALVFQSIGALEDSFDIEGMQEAAKAHNVLVQALAAELMPKLDGARMLGAGACHVCERCSKLDELPCRFPEKAIASLEAHGIAVSELATLGGMKYVNGQNTVTYFGGVLFS